MRRYGTPGHPVGLLSPKSANQFTHIFFIVSIIMILIGGESHNDALLGIGFAVMFCNTLIDVLTRRGPYALKIIIVVIITVSTIKLFHMSQATADGILQWFMNIISKATSGLSK